MLTTAKSKEPEEVRIAIWLNIMGPEGIKIYVTFKLTEAEAKQFKFVVQKCDEYCIPRNNKIYERSVFNI